MVPAYADGGSAWRERMRAGLGALLVAIDEQPALGALCVVDALAGGPAALERRAQVLDALVDTVHEGRREIKAAHKPERLAAEGAVGAVLSVIHGRLPERDPAPLVKLLNPLMAMVVLPYLGSAAARREFARHAPRARRRAATGRPTRCAISTCA